MREGAHHVQPFGAKRGGVEGGLCITFELWCIGLASGWRALIMMYTMYSYCIYTPSAQQPQSCGNKYHTSDTYKIVF